MTKPERCQHKNRVAYMCMDCGEKFSSLPLVVPDPPVIAEHLENDWAEPWARLFHETYERLAPQFDYETRKESAKPWIDVPENNKRLMVAVVEHVLQLVTCQPAVPFIAATQPSAEPLRVEEHVYVAEPIIPTAEGVIGWCRGDRDPFFIKGVQRMLDRYAAHCCAALEAENARLKKAHDIMHTGSLRICEFCEALAMNLNAE